MVFEYLPTILLWSIGTLLVLRLINIVISFFRTVSFYGTSVRKAITHSKRITKNTEYIYIYSANKENPFYVKIGRTKNNPVQRLRAQQTANPYGINVLAVIPVGNSVIAESVFHRLFHNRRVSSRNEWFKLDWKIFLAMLMFQNPKLTDSIRFALRREVPKNFPK